MGAHPHVWALKDYLDKQGGLFGIQQHLKRTISPLKSIAMVIFLGHGVGWGGMIRTWIGCFHVHISDTDEMQVLREKWIFFRGRYFFSKWICFWHVDIITSSLLYQSTTVTTKRFSWFLGVEKRVIFLTFSISGAFSTFLEGKSVFNVS